MSATTTAAIAVQNPSMSELHMVQAKHSKKDQLQKIEASVPASPATDVEPHLHTQRRSSLPEMQRATSVGRRDTSRVITG